MVWEKNKLFNHLKQGVDPRYEFKGEQFLERFDDLAAANTTLSEELDNPGSVEPKTLERYLEKVFRSRNRMDDFFSGERLMIYGGEDEDYFELEWDAESYREMVNIFNSQDLPTVRKQDIPYRDTASPYTVLAFEDELVEEWEITEELYQKTARIENRFREQPETESVLWQLSEKGYDEPEYIEMMALGFRSQ